MSLDQKWGVIGYGAASKNFCSSFKNISKSKLYAVSSISKFDEIKKNNLFNFKLYNNYNDIINDKNIDIFYVGVANFLHFPCLKQIIDSGKNVLIEKPSCLKYEDLHSISEAIKSKKIYFKESILYLGHPIIKIIREMLKNNEIGNILKLKSKFGFNFNKKKFFFFRRKKNLNLFNKNNGGGVIFNYAHYPLSSFLSLCDNIKNPELSKVKNLSKSHMNGLEVYCKSHLEFNQRILVETEISLVHNLDSILEIYGDKGSLKIYNPWMPHNKFSIIKSCGSIQKNYIFEEKSSLWDIEKKNIYNDFINQRKEPSVFGTNLNSSLLYLKYIKEWRNKLNENL